MMSSKPVLLGCYGGTSLIRVFRVTRPNFRESAERYQAIGYSQIIAATSDNYLRC